MIDPNEELEMSDAARKALRCYRYDVETNKSRRSYVPKLEPRDAIVWEWRVHQPRAALSLFVERYVPPQ